MSIRSIAKDAVYALRRLAPRGHGTLVLAYHSVDSFDDEYTVSRETFAWQLDEILRQGLRVISLRELERMLDAGQVEDGTVVLTFDDGRADNYTNLFPVIRECNVPVAIFSITGFIGKTRPSSVRHNPMLTPEEMREMHASGLVDFQPHTETHPKLTTMSLEEVRREVADSKRTIESMFAKECPYFAYPYGRRSPEIERVVRECGIRLSFATHAGFVTSHTDRGAIPRNHIRHDVTPAQFKSILNRGSLR